MEWIDPKEEMPKEGQMVLMLTKNVRHPEVAVIEKYDGYADWYICSHDDVEKTENVLKWSPITLPPKN